MGKLKQRHVDDVQEPDRNTLRDRAEAELEKRRDMLEETYRRMRELGYYDDIDRKTGEQSPF